MTDGTACAMLLRVRPGASPKPPAQAACVLPRGHPGRCVAIVVQVWSVEGPMPEEAGASG